MLTTTTHRVRLNAGRAARWLEETAVSPLQSTVQAYQPISLAEMEDVALLSRVDTKFVLGVGDLLAALAELRGDYRVLEVAGVRLNHYQTLYFDTPDFALYQRHHAGAPDRYKVRSRAYVDSDVAFLEVKHKTNKKRTVKERLQTPQLVTDVGWAGGRETAVFLRRHYPFDAAELVPTLWNTFTRVTLVGCARAERVTLDFDLAFAWGRRQAALPGVAIAEVKQEGYAAESDFVRRMRACAVRPTSFSKYCLGAGLLYPHLKHNNFKPQRLLIQKLLNGGNHDRTH